MSNPLKAPVLNRGIAPDSFLDEIVEWAKKAPEELFAPNSRVDIYSKIKPELGPWRSPCHRKAALMEVLRVLAGFESSWNWREGVDTSRAGPDTSENSEAGAWQISYNSRRIDPDLQKYLIDSGVRSGWDFQQKMKSDHPFAMEYTTRILRVNTRHNGPLYKAEERNLIRSDLRDPKHSIYPWLSNAAVEEFERRLI